MKSPTANPKSAGASPGTLRRTFTLLNPNGLHARPCALLDRALQPFNCTVQVVHDDASADAHSLFGLMSLAAGYESNLTFVVTGRDAAKAMAAVARLFETNFEEAYPPQAQSR